MLAPLAAMLAVTEVVQSLDWTLEIQEPTPSQPPQQCSLFPAAQMTQPMIEDAAALCYLLHENISVLFSQAVNAASLQLGEPKNYKQAISGVDSQIWKSSMQEELDSHQKCGTYVPVTLPKGVKVVPLQWVYKIKQNEKGEPIRAKSRLVARGDMCVAGVHFEAIHAPVVHFATQHACSWVLPVNADGKSTRWTWAPRL